MNEKIAKLDPEANQPQGIMTFSLGDDVPGSGAEEPNWQNHDRVGVFETDSVRQLCLVRSLSRVGSCVRVYRRFKVGTVASIDLKTGSRLSGTVVWAQMGHVGLEFDAAVDVEALFSTETLEARGHRARMPRVRCEVDALVRSGTRLVKCRGVDISQGGIKVASEETIPVGEAVVSLPGLYPIVGEVRWSGDRQAGIAFNDLVPLRRLLERTRQWSAEAAAAARLDFYRPAARASGSR